MSMRLAFNVVPLNDAPSIDVTDGETSDGTKVVSTVDENAAGVLIGKITISDPDQILTAEHISISDDRFVVVTREDGLWLALADGVSLDYELEPSVDVMVTVTDDEGATAQKRVTVTVHNIDEAPDAPSITASASNLMIEENISYGVNLALLDSQDPEGDDITFQVDNPDFEIEVMGPVAILKLKPGVSLDREATEDGTIILTVTASDSAGNESDPAEVVVTILDVNEAPMGDATVGAVNAGTNTPATGNINARDADAGDTLRIAVDAQPAYGTLTIDQAGAWTYMLDEADDAVVALAEGVTLEDTATIVISDNQGAATTVDVTIVITGANENPAADDASGTLMVGGDPVDGNLDVTDLDEGDTHTFSVATAPAYGRLTVSKFGTWTYRLDQAEQSGSPLVALAEGATLEDTASIVITDSSGGTATSVLTITIVGVNDAPTAEDASVTIMADGTFVDGRVNASDPDQGDVLSYSLASAPAYGAMSVNGAGRWTYVPDATNPAVVSLPAGATLEDTASIVITDSSGSMTTAMVTITITGVNDAPTAEGAMGAVLVGGDPDTGTIDVSDPDEGDTLSISVGATPNYGTLEVDSAGNWTYTLDQQHADVTALAENATLSDEGTILITDGSGATATVTIPITIYASNAAPSISVADSSVDENSAGIDVASIVVSDPNQDLSARHVTTSDERFVIRSDDAGDLMLALADGVSLDHEAEPTVELILTVTDDLDTASQQTVILTVENKNDPPAAPKVTPAAFTIRENDDGGINLADLVSTDPEGDDITFHVDNPSFEIEAIGSAVLLRLKDGVALDREATADGTLTLQVTASDPSGSTSDPTLVVVTVENVNEPPSINFIDGQDPDGSLATLFINENDTGPLGSFTVSDPEQSYAAEDIVIEPDDDRFSVEADENGGFVLILNEGLDAETTEVVTLTLEVTDEGGLRGSAEVTINVVEVNEPPSLTVTDAHRLDGTFARSIVAEHSTGAVGLITLADPEDELDASSVTLSNTQRFSTETDEEGRIWLIMNQAADYETDGGTLSVTLTVTDSGNISDEVMLDLAITDVNEAPSLSVMDGETPDGVPVLSRITENTTGLVGAIMLFDPDHSDQRLGKDDITPSDDRFSIVQDAFGGLWLALDEPVDGDAEANVTLELMVEDSGGLVETVEVSIDIELVNEQPTLTVTDATRLDGTRARPVIKENETGALGLITIGDPEEDLGASDITLSDTRFAIETDGQGRIWLMLGEAADYEIDGGRLSVTLTARDSEGLRSEPVDVNVRIVPVNDPPQANQDGVRVITQEATDEVSKQVEVQNDVFATAGAGEVEIRLDLGTMFSDQDGDSIFHYRLENAPDWLSLSYQYDRDGSITGVLGGTVPAGDDTSLFDIRLIAVDQGGASGFTLFNVIVDDGNDQISAVNLFGADGNEINLNLIEIAENDASGVFIGRLTAEDLDSARHPNGTHTFEVAPAYQDQFETLKQGDDWILKVKDDVALDYETEASISFEVIAKDGGGSSLTRVVTVTVIDTNDSPIVKNAPGNWWVTVDEDLDAEDVLAGDWLQFALETAGDALPLFEDMDWNDTLTYSIVSGPSWLEIDENTGVLRNQAETLPTRGIHDVTVRATDEAGDYAQESFQIAVVLSDENNADNSDPDIDSDGVDIREDAGPGAVVATITIEDEDLDVAGIHPWGDLTIVVSATADVGDQTGVTIQSAKDFMDDDPSNDFFRLEKTSEDRDSVSYNLVLTEQAFDGDNAINAESYDEVELIVTAYDGTVDLAFDQIDRNTEGADVDELDFEIDDINEAPTLDANELGQSHTSKLLAEVGGAYVYPVEQQQDADKDFSAHLIYLNLSKLFEDPDEDHDDRDVTFTASISNTPWLSAARHWNSDTESYTQGAVKWEDIKDGLDEDEGTSDDVAWNSGATPDEDDYVLILEVDRTGDNPVTDGDPMPNPAEIGQDADGLVTITARDDDGASSITHIAVTITDENLDPHDEEGFEVSGIGLSDTTPREKDTITISFNQDVDPDFTGANGGSPVAVIYQAINVEGGETGPETVLAASVNSPLRYQVKQSDVDDAIKGRVIYYELFEGSIVPSDEDNAALELNSGIVEDRQDRANITFSFSTNDNDELVANTPDQDKWDPDGVDSSTITYVWEYSVNGRGGWTIFDGDGDANMPDTNMATIPSTVAGHFVRLVVSFNDNDGVSESVASPSVKVGTIDTLDSGDIPAIEAGGQKSDIPVGRILRIDLEDATPTGGSVRANWLADDELVGTGASYQVTEDDRGKTISVRITSFDGDGNVTSIVTTDGLDTVAARLNTSPLARAENFTIDLGAAPAEEGVLVSHMYTVPMSSLFEDLEGGLTFDFLSPSAFSSDSLKDDTSLDLYFDRNDGEGRGDQLLIVDEATGAVDYFTTMSNGHDDDQADGGGNLVILKLRANDQAANNGNGASADINVQLRIDVAPTGFQVSEKGEQDPSTDATTAAGKPYDFEGTGATLSEDITVAADQQGNQTNPQIAARIDVQDENMGDHAYGQYMFAVDDDRFEVIVDEDDGSKATLRLKTGQSLDFEELAGPVNDKGNKSILVVVTATPVSENFDPITLGITVSIENDKDDDPPEPPDLGNNKVPGLKDDETGADDDDTTDDTTDDDEDAGTPASMDALAGLVTILDDGMF